MTYGVVGSSALHFLHFILKNSIHLYCLLTAYVHKFLVHIFSTSHLLRLHPIIINSITAFTSEATIWREGLLFAQCMNKTSTIDSIVISEENVFNAWWDWRHVFLYNRWQAAFFWKSFRLELLTDDGRFVWILSAFCLEESQCISNFHEGFLDFTLVKVLVNI